MSRRAPFTEADVRRAIKGAAQAGVAVTAVTFMPGGGMRLEFGYQWAAPALEAIDVMKRIEDMRL